MFMYPQKMHEQVQALVMEYYYLKKLYMKQIVAL